MLIILLQFLLGVKTNTAEEFGQIIGLALFVIFIIGILIWGIRKLMKK